MSEPQDSRLFFRLVETNPPTRRDFLSYSELGIGLVRQDEESVRLSTGISVFRTDAQARRIAKRRSFRGTFFIAVLGLPIGADYRLERTKPSPGHFTLWADPDIIASWVARMIPV